MGGDTERMAQLEARLERLENLESIRDSLHRYAHAIDYGRQSDWVDCFTKDGRFVFKFLPGKSPYAGPEPAGRAGFSFQSQAAAARFSAADRRPSRDSHTP